MLRLISYSLGLTDQSFPVQDWCTNFTAKKLKQHLATYFGERFFEIIEILIPDIKYQSFLSHKIDNSLMYLNMFGYILDVFGSFLQNFSRLICDLKSQLFKSGIFEHLQNFKVLGKRIFQLKQQKLCGGNFLAKFSLNF